ncbi:MAG TPA: tetratricopeptide repeat protein [Polyangiaceae bacterium]|jgi:tetratricopeptide (TPR) repeat protein
MGTKGCAVSLVLLSALVVERGALADLSPADQEIAQSWFERGYAARVAGNFGEARADFQKSYEIDHAPGTMLNMAACEEHMGRMATAWRELLRGAADARNIGRQDWAVDAEREAEQIQPTLPRLVLHLERGFSADDRRITLDGEPFPEPMVDASMPVDRGSHRVEATAPAKRLWATTFEAKDQAVSVLTVPLLEPEVAIPVVLRRPRELEAEAPPSRPRRTWELGLGVLGGVSVLAATALTVSAYATYKGAGCTAFCTSAARAAQDRAWTQADVATVLGGVGAGALLGAALLWVWDPLKSAHVEARPIAGATAIGLSLRRGW